MNNRNELNKDLLLNRIATIRYDSTKIKVGNTFIDLNLSNQINVGANKLNIGNELFDLNRKFVAKENITAHRTIKENNDGISENIGHGFASMFGFEFLMFLEHMRDASTMYQTGLNVKFNVKNLNNEKRIVHNDFKLSDYRTRMLDIRNTVKNKKSKKDKKEYKKGL